jgi:hypothetical protein
MEAQKYDFPGEWPQLLKRLLRCCGKAGIPETAARNHMGSALSRQSNVVEAKYNVWRSDMD